MFKLLLGELKHEVFGEALTITLDSLIERFGLDAVKLGQVVVEHDLAAANQIDTLLDGLDWNDGGGGQVVGGVKDSG